MILVRTRQINLITIDFHPETNVSGNQWDIFLHIHQILTWNMSALNQATVEATIITSRTMDQSR